MHVPPFDSIGRPDLARHLVRDAFKGGNQRDSIHLRAVTRMPGTPHRASVRMMSQQLISLTHNRYALDTAARPCSYDSKVVK